MFLDRKLCIDLGSDTIKIYDNKTDMYDVEKDIAAVYKRTNIIAVGNEAYEMLDMVPKSIKLNVPITSGRISDVMHVESLLHYILFSKLRILSLTADLYFSVPPDMTEIERRAYASISKRGKLKNCDIYLIEKPYADAAGMDVDITRTRGSMILNIGDMNADLAVIADKRIILNRSLPLAGRRINEAIISSVRNKNRLSVSYKTADDLKQQLATLEPNALPGGVMASGVDTGSGLPRDGYVSSGAVCGALRSIADELVVEIKSFLERTPPQILDYVLADGISLAGGTSKIPGLADYLSEALNCPIKVSPKHERTTLVGLRKICSDANYASFIKPASGKGK